MTGHDERHHGDEARDPAFEKSIERALDQAPRQRLDEEELAALFGDELAPSERGELVDRLIADPDALAKLKSLRPLRAWSDGVAGAIEESRRFESQSPGSRGSNAPRFESRRRKKKRPARRWALAAGLLAAVGAGLLLPQLGFFDEPETLRNQTIAAAPVAIEPADGARLSAPPSSFVFSVPGEPGHTFTVMLFDEDSTLLWRSPPASEERVELPNELVEQLQDGRTYLWRVSSHDGLDEHRWPLASFEITP